jgi:hypothetical protein
MSKWMTCILGYLQLIGTILMKFILASGSIKHCKTHTEHGAYRSTQPQGALSVLIRFPRSHTRTALHTQPGWKQCVRPPYQDK